MQRKNIVNKRMRSKDLIAKIIDIGFLSIVFIQFVFQTFFLEFGKENSIEQSIMNLMSSISILLCG